MENDRSERSKESSDIKETLCHPDTFKKVFFKAAQKFHAQSDTEFEVDSKNKNFLGHFCRYWNQDLAFEVLENISLQKGLMVFGSYGSGKKSSFQMAITTPFQTPA